MICGLDNFAGEKIYFQENDDLRPRQFAREKVFECFQDNDELHPRQKCRRKSLWIISG